MSVGPGRSSQRPNFSNFTVLATATADENHVPELPTRVTNRLLLTKFKNVPGARLEQDKSRQS